MARGGISGALDDILRMQMNNQRLQLEKERMDQNNKIQQERIDNQRTFQQAQLMMAQLRLQGMQQANALKQQELAEKVREYNESQKAGGPKGRQSTQMQAQNDILDIANSYDAMDPETGKIDMSKIPAYYQQRIQEDELYIQKQGGTAYGQKRILQFSNALASMESKNIEPLEYYSGEKGKARLKRDQIKALITGDVPEELQKYNTLVRTTIPNAAEQIGQAFGGSVQEYATSVRNNAFYDKGWINDPDQVLDQWNELHDIAVTEKNNAMAQFSNPEFNLTGNTATGTDIFQTSPPINNVKQNIPIPINNTQPIKYNATDSDVIEAANKAGMSPAKMAEIMNGVG